MTNIPGHVVSHTRSQPVRIFTPIVFTFIVVAICLLFSWFYGSYEGLHKGEAAVRQLENNSNEYYLGALASKMDLNGVVLLGGCTVITLVWSGFIFSVLRRRK